MVLAFIFKIIIIIIIINNNHNNNNNNNNKQIADTVLQYSPTVLDGGAYIYVQCT